LAKKSTLFCGFFLRKNHIRPPRSAHQPVGRKKEMDPIRHQKVKKTLDFTSENCAPIRSLPLYNDSLNRFNVSIRYSLAGWVADSGFSDHIGWMDSKTNAGPRHRAWGLEWDPNTGVGSSHISSKEQAF
jgi:hypothetical protein